MVSLFTYARRTAIQYRRPLLAWIAIALVLAAGGWISGAVLLLQLLLIALFLTVGRMRTVLKFVRRLWFFEAVAGRHVELRFDAELKDRIDLAQYAEHWDECWEALGAEIGELPPFRPIIQLFGWQGDLDALLGDEAPSLVLARLHTVVVSLEIFTLGVLSEEFMRHELARLATCHWSAGPPPLCEGGLLMWLQGCYHDGPVDLHALAVLREEPKLSLRDLMAPADPTANREQLCLLAGSFIGYLVRHYGWVPYRAWYSQAAQGSAASFQEQFGCDLAAAEQSWRAELAQRQPEFEPALAWELRRRAARRAATGERWEEALCEFAALLHVGQAWENDLRTMSWHYLTLRDYAAAREAISAQLTTRKPRQLDLEAGYLWLRLGQLHGFQDEPEQAEQAYRQCLVASDFPYGDRGWGHDEARERLRKLERAASARAAGPVVIEGSG